VIIMDGMFVSLDGFFVKGSRGEEVKPTRMEASLERWTYF